MTNLDSILKNKRHYFADKGSSSQSYGFSSSQVCMWKLSTEKLMVLNCSAGEDSSESCSPRTARRANQLILKEISPEYSLEGLMLKLKLQYFGHLMRRSTQWKRPWCWQRMKMGGEGDNRGQDGWVASLTRWTWVWASSGSCWWTRKPGMLPFMGSPRVGHDWLN